VRLEGANVKPQLGFLLYLLQMLLSLQQNNEKLSRDWSLLCSWQSNDDCVTMKKKH